MVSKEELLHLVVLVLLVDMVVSWEVLEMLFRLVLLCEENDTLPCLEELMLMVSLV
jgi:hypothetical protein